MFTEKVVCVSKRYQGTEMVGEVVTGGSGGVRGRGWDVGHESSRSSGPLELDCRWKEGGLRQMLFAQRLY